MSQSGSKGSQGGVPLGCSVGGDKGGSEGGRAGTEETKKDGREGGDGVRREGGWWGRKGGREGGDSEVGRRAEGGGGGCGTTRVRGSTTVFSSKTSPSSDPGRPQQTSSNRREGKGRKLNDA